MQASTRKGIFAALLVAWLPAQALIIEIEPDNWAAGTDVSRLTTGVTLSVVTLEQIGVAENGLPLWSPVNGGAVYSTASALAATGDSVFGWAPEHSLPTGEVLWGEVGPQCLFAPCWAVREIARFDRVLRLDFDTPTDYVSVIGRMTGGDPTTIWPFDENQAFVPGCVTGCATQRYSAVHPFSITDPIYGYDVLVRHTPAANIKTVFIGGIDAKQPLDRLRFNDMVSVPEPSTLGLFLIAAAAIAARASTLRKGKGQLSFSSAACRRVSTAATRRPTSCAQLLGAVQVSCL
jgi:hypothetical protein